MPGVTKVGPPERGDYRKKPGPVGRFFRWWSRRFDTLIFAAAWRRRPVRGIDDAAMRIVLGENEDQRPSHGLAEVDLTDEEREAAIRRIKREESLRRARGE